MTDEEFDALRPGDLIVPFSYSNDPNNDLIYVILERVTSTGLYGYFAGLVFDPNGRRRATQEFVSYPRYWNKLPE